jgi:non-ribosomal peptide synthetase component E (peptide arylation enzyme)
MAFEIKTNLTQEKIEKYIKEGAWPRFTLSDRLDRPSRPIPDEIFITDLRKRITYRQFNLITKRTSVSS